MLTSKQTDLIEEVGAAHYELLEHYGWTVADAGASPSTKATGGNDAIPQDELVYKHHNRLQRQIAAAQFEDMAERWQWITKVGDTAKGVSDELGLSLQLLHELDQEKKEVINKTNALHERSQTMLEERDKLQKSIDKIKDRLRHFDCVPDIVKVVEQPDPTQSDDLFRVWSQLDESLAFVEQHFDLNQVNTHRHQFEQLRNRICLSVRSAVQRSIASSAQKVDEQLQKMAGQQVRIDSALFYTHFRVSSRSVAPLTHALADRVELHESYLTTLEELESYYASTRFRLLGQSLEAHTRGILAEHDNLGDAARQSSSYILSLCELEREAYEEFFAPRTSQQALWTLLEQLGDLFYNIMRPPVLVCNEIDVLREIADALSVDVLEHHAAKGGETQMAPVLALVYRLHTDAQERLIYRTETYIRDMVSGYQVTDADVNYPSVLLKHLEGPVDGEFRRGWFPTLDRVLLMLSKVYRILEVPTFQGIAQDSVNVCLRSLRQVSDRIATKYGTPEAPNVDALLFLIKHLLILREQIASFECDLVSRDRFFSFSNAGSSLMDMVRPDTDMGRRASGLLGLFTPTVQETPNDAKKNIEADLRTACERFISHQSALIAFPLVDLQVEIKDHGSRGDISKQQFASKTRLKDVCATVWNNLQMQVPMLVCKLRLYLIDSSSSKGQQDASNAVGLMFKPVQNSLVDSWRHFEQFLIDKLQTDRAALDAMDFHDVTEVHLLLKSLFDFCMDEPLRDLCCRVGLIEDARTGLGLPIPADKLQSGIQSSTVSANASTDALPESTGDPAAPASQPQ